MTTHCKSHLPVSVSIQSIQWSSSYVFHDDHLLCCCCLFVESDMVEHKQQLLPSLVVEVVEQSSTQRTSRMRTATNTSSQPPQERTRRLGPRLPMASAAATMLSLAFLFLCCCCPGVAHASELTNNDSDSDDDATTTVRVVVGLNHLVSTTAEEERQQESSSLLKSDYGPRKLALQEFAAAHGAVVTAELHRTHAVALQLPASRVAALEGDSAFVQYLEWDRRVYYSAATAANNNNNEETITWATDMVGALTAPNMPPRAPADQVGTETCFKVCVVDAGVLAAHPDLPFTRGSPYIRGTEFGIADAQQKWYNPVDPHGTHVAGIMLAEAFNGRGIAGVIPDAAHICLLVARVFDDSGTGQNDSKILEGAEWCADQGARVINLSLGAAHSGTQAARDVYNRIVSDGALVVSAAGNDGTATVNYPAGFPNVVGVGAVDSNKNRATFSNYNSQVNLAAPGQLILSTVSVLGIVDSVTGTTYEARNLDYAPQRSQPVTGVLVDVGLAAQSTDCASARGQLCLATRGTSTFVEKMKCCQDAGGLGLIIANNIPGPLAGTLGTDAGVSIPVVSVSQADGTALRQLPPQRSVSLSFTQPGYDQISGTSMATPFVAGLAARIWSLRPECTNEQVRQALYAGAENLGSADFYGHGLVQAQQAYDALLAQPAPCGTAAVSSPSGAGGAAAAGTGNSNNSNENTNNGSSNNRWSSWNGGTVWGGTTWNRLNSWWGDGQQDTRSSRRPSVGSLMSRRTDNDDNGHHRRSLRGEAIVDR